MADLEACLWNESAALLRRGKKNTPFVIPDRQILQDPFTGNLFDKLCDHLIPAFANGRTRVFPRNGSRAGWQECPHKWNIEPKWWSQTVADVERTS